MTPLENAAACPCGTGRSYVGCCGRYHSGARRPPTAVALMRSRYTAFALGLRDYLSATWHPTTRPETLLLDAETTWTGLDNTATTHGQAWEDEGTVTFAAAWVSPQGSGVLRERSRFVVEDGRWFYLDGVTG